jgi:hypothetical protein
MSLPLADDQLLLVAQREQPALAAQRAHLPNVIHVHDGISMNPLKLELA